ncbi:MAG: M20/M25/M40 family metallo-hydrolase [Bacteroidetes bacterium]|nr:MAG: M20/M25/M40 family metallo-hydrolase [Bacteroidota bacterium]
MAADLRPDLELLASDSLQGREAGTPGAEMAAAFIEARFRALGLRPVVGDSSYRQSLRLDRVQIRGGFLAAGGRQFRHLEEVICWEGAPGQDSLHLPLVVAAGAEDAPALAGKAVLIRAGMAEIRELAGRYRRRGAAALLAVTADSPETFAEQSKLLRLYLAQGRMKTGQDSPMPILLVSPLVASHVLKVPLDQLDAAFQSPDSLSPLPVSIAIDQVWTYQQTDNVIGYLPGAGKPEETVMVTAHYDHLGERRGKLFPGADDNASGVVALLEIAEAFAEAREQGLRPYRSVVFMAFAAEEKGLLGSDFYADHPVFDLEQTVVNLNMDMVGHLDDAHGPKEARFVSIVGSDWLSADLHQIHEAANARYTQLLLDYTYNAKDHPERFYYRSDQYHFAKHGIPVIFYTSGDHEDYHQPSDRVENIHFGRLQGVARLVFYTAWEVAFRPERLRLDPQD